MGERSGFEFWPGKSCCFLGQDTFLHTGVQMGLGEFNARGSHAMDYNTTHGGVEIFLVASCFRNRDKLRH